MAARDTNKPDTNKPDEAESTPEPATSQPADPQRVIIEQAPAEPAVFYGDGGIQPATAGQHVKADYKPFEW